MIRRGSCGYGRLILGENPTNFLLYRPDSHNGQTKMLFSPTVKILMTAGPNLGNRGIHKHYIIEAISCIKLPQHGSTAADIHHTGHRALQAPPATHICWQGVLAWFSINCAGQPAGLEVAPHSLLLVVTPTHVLQFFVMGEVATQLFQQRPNAFVQELRRGQYPKTICNSSDVLQAVVQLGLEVEGSASSGVMLLAPGTVEQLLQDKRRLDLLQSFKVAMLKLASQVRSTIPAVRSLRAAVSRAPLLQLALMPRDASVSETSTRHVLAPLSGWPANRVACMVSLNPGGGASDGCWRL